MLSRLSVSRTGAALLVYAAAGEAAVDEPVAAQALRDAVADRLDAAPDVLLGAGAIWGRSGPLREPVTGHG